MKISFFENFVSLYLILFYFFKKKIQNLLFTVDRSTITFGHNTKIVLQHNLPIALLYCNTIFQLSSLAIHSCILQYNFHQSSSLQYNSLPTRLGHNTLIVLQYNFNSPLASLIAIQFCNTILAYSSLSHNTICVLQYNFFFPTNYTPLQYNLLYCNTTSSPQAFFSTIQKLYCNTIFNTHSTCNTILLSCTTKATISQYNAFLAIQKFSFSQYNLGSSPKTVLHNFFFSLLLLLFSHLFPATGKIKKIIHLIFFFIFHNTQINS